MNAFSIEILRLHWIREAEDDPDDLCLHGDIVVRIGETTLRESSAVSAASLMLMRAIGQDHPPGSFVQMLPCCGHAMYEAEDGQSVQIISCDCGTDFLVRHDGDMVWLTPPDGEAVPVPLADYRREVYAFADAVRAHYRRCTPKRLPDDPADRAGYLAFWREWHMLRGAVNE